MKTLLTILFIVCSYAVSAQQPAMAWLIGYGGSSSDQINTAVTKTADNGFILSIESNSTIGTGNIDSFCAIDGERIVFLKYNADASTLEWSKCYQLNGDSSFIYMFPTTDGDNILGGEFNVGWGFVICKEDASGNIIWQHNYSKGNGAILRSMIATNDGGYLMLGESLYTDSNVLVHYGSFMDPDLWILKVDSNGDKVWSKVIGGTGYESGGALVSGPNGGCYVVGGTGSDDYDCTGSHGGGEVYLARLDSNGNLLWHKDMGGSSEDVGIFGYTNGKGGLIIAAEARSGDGQVHHNHGGSDFWALEVDSAANILWDNCYGGVYDEIPATICKTTDGTIWIGGFATAQNGEVDTFYDHFNNDGWLVHADTAGNFLSAKVLGSSDVDQVSMVYPLSSTGVAAGGYFSKNNGAFSGINWYGEEDAFLSVFAPWTTSVKEIIKEDDYFEIYPNPASDYLKIKTLQQTNEKYIITINDIVGRRVYNEEIPVNEQVINIDVNGFAKGIYYVQMIEGDGRRTTEKVIIE